MIISEMCTPDSITRDLQAKLMADGDPEDYNRNVMLATQAIMFFGTPHSGTDWADLASGFVDLINMSLVKQANKNVVDFLRRNPGQFSDLPMVLINLNERRQRGHILGAQKIALHCFNEGKPIHVGVFKWVRPLCHRTGEADKREAHRESESANHLGYHTRNTINADHVQMTKFKKANDPGFIAVCVT